MGQLTYFRSVDDEQIQIYHPGNYVFHDNIQMSIGTTEKLCPTVWLRLYHIHLKKPYNDAGSKHWSGQGGHGNTNIKDGYIKLSG